MDIKDLNKSQLILLAVLLSFITSIATGITTVTLMQQAPSSVTVPVNRIIRQTVEKIQQVEGKTQTIVVKEEDLVVDAISKNRGAIFTITREDFAGLSPFRGFAIDAGNIVATDATLASTESTYYTENASGKFRADFMGSDKGIAFLKIGAPTEGENKVVFTLPIIGDLEKMKAGQKMIVLGKNIATYILEDNTNVNLSVSQENAGALVLNLDGEAIGIALQNGTTGFASMKTISESLAIVLK